MGGNKQRLNTTYSNTRSSSKCISHPRFMARPLTFKKFQKLCPLGCGGIKD
jgi:hypothetical protein